MCMPDPVGIPTLIYFGFSRGSDERPNSLHLTHVLSSVDEDKSILHLPAFYHPPITYFPPFPEQSPLPVSTSSTRAWGYCVSSHGTEQGADSPQMWCWLRTELIEWNPLGRS